VHRALVEVVAGIHVATSRRDTTTSTVVVRGGEALLVDPAWDPDELDALAETLTARSWTVVLGLATHAQHDHLLWHPGFGAAPRYASAGTVALARSEQDSLRDALGPEWPPALLRLVGQVRPAPADLDFAGTPVELVVHDGHVPGHAAVWLPAARVLLAGDMLSDVELPLPLEPDDLPAYLAGLDALAPYVAVAEVLVPGHGHPTSRPADRLDADRRYLDALLAGRDPDDPRRANPGMDEVHRRVRDLARAR
jgi:glyoxylase-like metal-dependent hydrolase (beta-lactamase superfamily II)